MLVKNQFVNHCEIAIFILVKTNPSLKQISTMKSLRQFIISPFFLSLFPLIIVILLIHNKFDRYLFEMESSRILSDNNFIMYEDLDNDGTSEKITAFDQLNSTGITVRKNNDDVIGQWNLSGSFRFYSKECLYITGDHDNNGAKEIYAFTLRGDSIFLNCIPDLKSIDTKVRRRFLARTGPGIKTPDPFIIPAEMDDLDNDGSKELIFGIGSGFSIYPRKVFAYNIIKDTLESSPESSFFIFEILQCDVNGDDKKEIIPYGYATCNVSPGNAKYHDCSNFLIVLKNDLKFLFEPVEFKGEYGHLKPIFCVTTRTQNSLALLFKPPSESDNSKIYFVSPGGILADSLLLSFHALDCFNSTDMRNNKTYLITSKKYGVGLYSERFELIRNMPGKEGCLIFHKDIDMDGVSEIILIDFTEGNITVSRERLTKPVELSFSSSGSQVSFVSFIKTVGSDPEISVQSGTNHYIFRYRQNPFYPYYYLIYLVIYVGVLGFALILINIQKNQLRKKYDTEKKIAQLQLALIRNQLDPHFTLNAINSVIYSVENLDRDLAGDQLRKFAGLYRSLLLSAGSIQRSVQEELDFCKDYLDLEKIRFGEKFRYFITVSDDVDRNILIPKLLIQLYVENAVKHGIALLPSGGILTVDLRNDNGNLKIEITDNGVGRIQSGNQAKISTGKGIEIMSELCAIFDKYYNVTINPIITDMYKDGNAAGTKVSVTISRHYEKR